MFGAGMQTLVADGYIPVVASVASDGKGQGLNVNADTAAGEVSVAQRASLDPHAFGNCWRSFNLVALAGIICSYALPCLQIAASLRAEKLILMTDVPGVMRDKDDPSTKFAALTIRECKELEDQGIIAGGMIPKVGGSHEWRITTDISCGPSVPEPNVLLHAPLAGGLLHPVAVPGRQRHPHHRRPPAALAADGAAHG